MALSCARQSEDLVVMIDVAAWTSLESSVQHRPRDRRGLDRPVLSQLTQHGELYQARRGPAEHFAQPDLRAGADQEAWPEDVHRLEGPAADGFLHFGFHSQVKIAGF